MMAIGFSRLLTPFMDEVDAVGYSMQFVPALFGALLIFPVYFIGKTLFNKKAGLIGALFIALIPIHLGSGHGSAYSLFDHDSFNLLLYSLTFMFLIKSIKEKDSTKSILYALLGGISLASLSMTWVEAQYLYVIIAIYAIVQMLMDMFTSKIEPRVARTSSIILISGYIISLPVIMAKWGGFKPNISLFLGLAVVAFGMIYYIFKRMRFPWTLSIPSVFCVGGVGLVFLYFIKDISSSIPLFSSLSKLSGILYGTGIYGNKVSMTIAEASTYGISRTVMSFGPALYWLGWIGFVFLAYHYYKGGQRRDYLFIIVLFLVQAWLTGVAGRFLNDLVPLIAILGGWIVWVVIDKIDYKQMLRNIRSAGGGIHGLRKGVKFLHIFGILFIAFLVIFPNAYLAFDAATPSTEKEDVFGDLPSGAFGLVHGKEDYWIDAFSWLKEQDTDIANPVERPAFISWWDYGFYESAIGDHPTVADNFQDGIPPASNFHTSTSEEEAVAVWIVRLMEGNVKDNGGALSGDVVLALEKYLGENDTSNVTGWVEDPENSPSYNAPIGREYSEELSEQYPVGQQWSMNAVYHDVTEVLVNELDDEEITWLYRDIQEITGYSIRYYGVEGYDKQIFNIFSFLADKSLLLVAGGGAYNPEDDYVLVKFVTQLEKELTFEELNVLTDVQLRQDPPVNTKQYYKDAYFDTMFYRTYIGVSEGESGSKSEPNYQVPCMDMRHFYAEYVSPYPEYVYYQGKSAVVIAKYYAGAYVDGSVDFMGTPVQAQIVVQKNVTHYGTEVPIDHDKNNTYNGNFSVIVPAGNITLQVRRYPELGAGAFTMKNVTFDSTTDPELAPITDDEAMRRGGDYNRLVNISIDSANIEGYVYSNKDTNDAYNESVDEPLSGATVGLVGIDEMDPSTGQPVRYDYSMYRELTTDEKGYYNASSLMPGYYRITTSDPDDFLIGDALILLYSGNTSHNISKPKPGAIEGNIYFDENGNSQYDIGEEMSNVDVKLQYTKLTTGLEVVDSLTTDETGSYSFSSLVPGQYTINATKLPDYEVEIEATIPENDTAVLNVSIEYAKVSLSGSTKDKDTGTTVSNISITGSYSAVLMPGSYNVTVNQVVNESGTNVTYVYSGQLEIPIGEGTKTFDLLMAKE
jgi:dolichyl-diphosphooligosaccharide--protein glycosyltransferase